MKHHSSKFRLSHLYRSLLALIVAALIVLLAMGSLTPPLPAQSNKQTGPRALAVLAWSGDSSTPDPATSILEPVAVYVEGRFYDATVYQNQPEPLAVSPGVLYDVLKSGDAIGTFTVGLPRQQGDTWFGLGRYEAKGAVVAKAKPAPPPKTNSGNADDRPHLRRGTPPPPAPKEQTDAVLSNIDRDPERPTLRRHTAADEKKPASPAPEKALIIPATHMLPAISTESGPEYHSFKFHDKPGELDQLQAAMEKLARAELDKGRKVPNPPETRATAGKTDRQLNPRRWPPVDLQNVKFGVYDVNSNNAPVLVYSSTAMVDGTKKYVTVAAWEEIDQSLRKIFAQVTDDGHLDVYPRLEPIDAVDARGNERGELLFRAFGDQGSRFLFYHPGPDSLELLFDSAR
jgi:hypothetical protein